MTTFPSIMRSFFVFWGLAKPKPAPVPPEPTPLQLATNAWVQCQRELLDAKLLAEAAVGHQDMLVKREQRLRQDVEHLAAAKDRGQVPSFKEVMTVMAGK